MTDNFSSQAAVYAQFRPGYPDELFEFIYSHMAAFDAAWDCATGNGQAAVRLSDKFKMVEASDISAAQLAQATGRPNIRYQVCTAERPPFPDASFDLITVAQALHWLDFDAFYREAARVARPGALLAAWTYTLPRTDPQTDNLLDDFYRNVTGPYWDNERKWVDDCYRTIPFPFAEIKSPVFRYKTEWERSHFTGYIRSWSAVQHFMKKEGGDPVTRIEAALRACWPHGQKKEVQFPIYLRLGRVQDASPRY